jgi:hypothetical protein
MNPTEANPTMTRATTMSVAATAPAKTNSRPLDTFTQTMKDTSVKEHGRKLSIKEFLALNLNGPIDFTPNSTAMIAQFKLGWLHCRQSLQQQGSYGGSKCIAVLLVDLEFTPCPK